LRSQKRKAKTTKEKDTWARWSIAQADLDNDTNTPNNVITYSDKQLGKVKAIDNYELMPRISKEINQTFYTEFPTTKERQKLGDKEKKLLKAYYRKYPTPTQQQAHPFADFVPELSPYQIIREGQLAAKHYMPLIQRLTGKAHLNILKGIYNLGDGYDFDADPQGVKAKRVRKNTSRILMKPDSEGKTFMERYLDANDYRIYTQEIPEAIQAIDGNRKIVQVRVNQDQQGRLSLQFQDLALN
jgi:hypothetical protein